MGIREDIDSYNEKMLKLQFQASEKIEHKLTKGELREKFLKRFLCDELEGLSVKNGIIVLGDWQSSQGDFIVLKKNARIGNMDVYDAEDCQLFMEVKSRVKKAEYEGLQLHAKEIKSKNDSIIVGMFSYASHATRKNVIPKFGIRYDEELDMFDAYDSNLDQYPDVDFYYNLNTDYEQEGETSYCIIKNAGGEKILFLQPPVIGNLINVFKRTIE